MFKVARMERVLNRVRSYAPTSNERRDDETAIRESAGDGSLRG